MIRKRINTDLFLRLSVVMKDGSPANFTGAENMKVVIWHSLYTNVRTEQAFTIDGNVISLQFSSEENKKTGKYGVSVFWSKQDPESETGRRDYAVDFTEAFQIVPYSDREDDGTIEYTGKVNQNPDGIAGGGTVDLSNYYKKKEVDDKLKKKVDSVSGKDLSTNDYTDEDKLEVGKVKNKVDSVKGKGLSTCDYTNEDRSIVQSISSFDPNTIYEALAGKLDPEQVYSKKDIDAMIEDARISLNLTPEQLSGLNVNLTPLQNELKEVNLFSLVGKKMVVLGDSSTAANGTMTNIKKGSWVSHVCTKLNLNDLSRNIAVGAATLRDRYDGEYSDNYSINEGQNTISSQVYRLIKYHEDKKGTSDEFIPDIIFIQAGGNDLPNNSYPYPKWDTYFGDFDTIMYSTQLTDLDYNPINISAEEGQNLHKKLKTFRSTLFGAMRWSIETLLTHFPNTTIFIGSPLQRGHEKNRNIFDLKNGMQRIAEFYNCPFVDCTSRAGMSWFTENRKTNGWSENWYTYDQTHKNDVGSELVGNFISSQIKQLYFDKPAIAATKSDLRRYTISTSFYSGSDNTQGNIVPLGNSIVQERGSLPVIITPNQGYEVEDVIVDGISKGALSEYTFENVVADGTLQAAFKRRTTPLNPPVLNSILINDGASETDTAVVSIKFNVSGGTPTQYKIASSEAGLDDTPWISYSQQITYTISGGLNTIYVKVKNEDGESKTVNASITYTTVTPSSGFISKIAFGHTMGSYDNGFTMIQSNLDKNVGVAIDIYDTEKNKVGTITPVIRGTGAAGGLGDITGDNSGLFEDKYLQYNTHWSAAYKKDTEWIQYDIKLSEGSYNMKIFGNTKKTITNLLECQYSINDVVLTPTVSPTNNFTEYLCQFSNLTGSTFILKIKGLSTGAKAVPINILEIEKIG